MSAIVGWSYAEVNAEHAAQGLSHHVEALAFRGASLSEILAQSVKGHVAPVVEPTAETTAPTVAPRKA